MRRTTVVLLATCFLTWGPAFGQSLFEIPSPEDVVTWQVRVIPETVSPGEDVSVVFTAELLPGWKMYGMESASGKPLAIEFDPQEGFLADGPVVEANTSTGYDPNFDAQVTFFHDESTGRASFRVSADARQGVNTLSGTVHYMACSDSVCLPPTDFPFKAKVRIQS